ETLLAGILGGPVVARDQPRRAERDLLIPLDEHAERRSVALARRLDQRILAPTRGVLPVHLRFIHRRAGEGSNPGGWEPGRGGRCRRCGRDVMRRLAVFWVLSALVVACAAGDRGPAATPETAPAVPAIAATPAAAPEGTATPPPALLSPRPGVLAVVSASSARPAVHALHPATGEDLPWGPAGPLLDWPNLVSPDGRYMAVGGGSSWSRL